VFHESGEAYALAVLEARIADFLGCQVRRVFSCDLLNFAGFVDQHHHIVLGRKICFDHAMRFHAACALLLDQILIELSRHSVLTCSVDRKFVDVPSVGGEMFD
jgi:hypothetical protein